MKRCRDGPARTVCTFLLLCLLKFGGITGVRWSLSHIHVMYIQILYNGDGGSALIFVYKMYGTVAASSALNEQRVRLYCCVCAWIWRCYWCSMQYEFVIVRACDILPSKHTTMAMMNLRWPVECMQWVSCWPETNSMYVCITVWLCAWTWRRYWRTQYEVLVSPSWCVVQIYTLQLRWRRLCVDLHSLFECMERVSIRAYVCISVCARALEFEAIIGVRCSMYEIAL